MTDIDRQCVICLVDRGQIVTLPVDVPMLLTDPNGLMCER
jgi:hypothetical protein